MNINTVNPVRFAVRVLILISIILLSACASQSQHSGETPLLKNLRQGGYVIFFRHAMTDHSEKDSDLKNLANCQTQRNLNEQGRLQSKTIGNSFQSLGIPVGNVITSYFCRCIDTANLAFQKASATMDITSIQGVSADVRAQRIANLRSMLNSPPAADTNTVLVAHKWMFKDAAGHQLEEGEAAIFKPQAHGMAQFVKRIKFDEWMKLNKAGDDS